METIEKKVRWVSFRCQIGFLFQKNVWTCSASLVIGEASMFKANYKFQKNKILLKVRFLGELVMCLWNEIMSYSEKKTDLLLKSWKNHTVNRRDIDRI